MEDDPDPTEQCKTPATTSSSQRLRTMLRQNSKKIGTMAENVVLPMHKRSIKRTRDEVDAIDLENQVALTEKQESQIIQKKFPIFIITVSVLQVLVFVYGGESAWLMFCYDPFRRYEIWRYLTEMLVHISLSHLLGNVIFQLILGLLLEIVHHWQRIGAIYMAGVLGGALAVTVLEPKVYSMGASAGVYGLLMAHLATIIINWDQMDGKCCRLFWLLAYIGLDVGLTVYSQLYLKLHSKVSHSGHFGGALAGFIAAVFILRNFEKLAWEKQFQKILAIITVILLLIVVIINISFPSYYFPSEFNFDYSETFMRYLFKSIYNSPDWSEYEASCIKDPECQALLQQFKNETGDFTKEKTGEW